MTMTDGRQADGVGQYLTTLPGRREFIASAVGEAMVMLTQDEYGALSKEDKYDYDEDRLDHHGRLQVVATSAVRHTVTCGRRLVIWRDQRPPRPDRHRAANTGKTIALTRLGLVHELQDRRRHPGQDERIPVIYITVPPAATPRMIAAGFARFLGLPVPRRSNVTDLTEAVVGVCAKARTGLVLVDEIHNISLHTRTEADASDTAGPSVVLRQEILALRQEVLTVRQERLRGLRTGRHP
ncbi:ATP-binding protein [Streptomyces sp. NPDC058240]|uniref:ATP-binding protein n=1 Tax=Streptomyces sp. NPDC058240 TaxID=3346396 RepID=UPI0036F0834E